MFKPFRELLILGRFRLSGCKHGRDQCVPRHHHVQFCRSRPETLQTAVEAGLEQISAMFYLFDVTCPPLHAF